MKQKEAASQRDLEKEASIKHFHDELEAKNKQVGLLEKQVKELEEKLQLLDAKSKEKVSYCHKFLTISRAFTSIQQTIHTSICIDVNLSWSMFLNYSVFAVFLLSFKDLSQESHLLK